MADSEKKTKICEVCMGNGFGESTLRTSKRRTMADCEFPDSQGR